MGDLRATVDEVNRLLAECRAADGPGESTYPLIPAVVIRSPLAMTEVRAFGKGETVPCIHGDERKVLEHGVLEAMIGTMERIIVWRVRRARLAEIRARCLTVVSEEELDLLLGSHQPFG